MYLDSQECQMGTNSNDDICIYVYVIVSINMCVNMYINMYVCMYYVMGCIVRKENF